MMIVGVTNDVLTGAANFNKTHVQVSAITLTAITD